MVLVVEDEDEEGDVSGLVSSCGRASRGREGEVLGA